jgi:hypothetical protein
MYNFAVSEHEHHAQEEALPLALPDDEASAMPSRVLPMPVKLSVGPSWGELGEYCLPP